MAEDRARRINDALSKLVTAFVPPFPEDDEALAEERHEDLLELSKSIVAGASGSAAVTDVNHAADLIKKKLLRENTSPEKAVRFSNLYSRLLTQPVLSQKWAILFLLYQVSGHPPSVSSPSVQEILNRTSSTKPVAPAVQTSRVKANALHSVLASQQNSPRISQKEKESKKESSRHGSQERIQTHSRNEDSVSQNSRKGSPKLTSASQPPTETTLLRDLPFTLQGLSSANLEFISSLKLRLPATLPIPFLSLLNQLAEPALLYRGLAEFVESADGGLIGQSLRAAIGQELRSYLGLVATLEAQIRHALAAHDDGSQNSLVTLKRCVIWTRDATLGLRLLSLIVEESKSRKGGQLISMVHNYSTSYGDPFVIAFSERLLKPLTHPFYDMLRQWIYDGELSDPYQEFFVTETSHSTDAPSDPRRLASSVWETKYKIDESLIPSIITPEFAKKVFLIGKSLNFIRYGCADSTWVEEHSKRSSRQLQYGDTATLESSIDEAYKTTMARLIYLMDVKFRLFTHLEALKKYLLLGQGDFIALLMESLAPNLDRPANSQYRHTLTAQLEHAIRASNAQYESDDVLRRLDARMLPPQHGDIGWDCFTLDYKIDAPVDVVITPWGNTQYLKVFNFLWRIKRVEFALGSTWRRCMTGARGVLGAVSDKVGEDWKSARCCIAEMIHFVNQLQYYILFEVIEASWDQLQATIHKPECTLDDLIDAHNKYLTSITHKGLLGAPRSRSGEESFLEQLHHILKLMLAYKDAIEGLYSFSVADFTRRQELSAKIEAKNTHTRWGTLVDDVAAPTPLIGPDGNLQSSTTSQGVDDHILPSLRIRLRDLGVDFHARINILLGDLAYQPDVDMRFLAVVMNFNDVYAPVRRKRRLNVSKERKGKEPMTDARARAASGSVASSATTRKDVDGMEIDGGKK